MTERILGLVLAGGEGRRLRPLTLTRCKPVVSFAGRYRVIDFVLSNFLNSDITAIHVLAQYKAESLTDHLDTAWGSGAMRRAARLRVVPPREPGAGPRYQGTADAVLQNLELVREEGATLVAIFGSDHVYRMDIRQMVEFHRSHGGGVTLGAAPVPLGGAGELGVLQVDPAGRVLGCEEKPRFPRAMDGAPDMVFASMGVWLVDPELLSMTLRNARAGQPPLAEDAQWMLTPELFPAGAVRAYDLRWNRVPGLGPTEEPAYWRDVGTLPVFWSAHMDLLGPQPHFVLENPEWPLRGGAGPAMQPGGQRPGVTESLLTEAVEIGTATVRRSVLGRGVRLGRRSHISESILMDGVVVGAGAHLDRVIVDSPNVIPGGLRLSPGDTADAAACFPGRIFADASGLVVLSAGVPEPAR